MPFARFRLFELRHRLAAGPAAGLRARAGVVLAGGLSLLVAATTASKAEILIGVALPQTGRYAVLGRSAGKAVDDAVKAVNAEGGVLGETIRIVTADDHCSEAGATSAARVLAGAGVKLVVGHVCEKAALAAAAVYGPAGTLLIAPAARLPALTERRAGKTVFRLSGREDRQGQAAGLWLAETAKSGKVAIVQDRTAYARGLTAGAVETLKTRNVTPLVFPIVASEKSYAPVIQGLVAGNVEAVFFAGYPAEAVIILAGLRKAGSKVQFLGCDSLLAPDFAGTEMARNEGVRVMMRPDLDGAAPATPGSDGDGAANGPADGHIASRTALAVRAWAAAARRAGSSDGMAVAHVLATEVFPQGDEGGLSFDENGDARIAGFVPAFWNGTNWTGSPK